MEFIKLHLDDSEIFINFDNVYTFFKCPDGTKIYASIEQSPEGKQVYVKVKETPDEICKLLGVSGDGD